MAAGQGSTGNGWELKVIDVRAEAEHHRANDLTIAKDRRVLQPTTSRAGYYADTVLAPPRKTPHVFEKYRSICLNEDGVSPIWSLVELKDNNFIAKDTTHIIELYDTTEKTLKGFAFLHAPAEPKEGAHAKCVLACGVSGKKWNAGGKSAMEIVHPKREEIAKKNGYTKMDLSAGNRALATKVWGAKYGFVELPGQEGKGDKEQIDMTKTLTGGGRRKTRKGRKTPKQGRKRTRRVR
jgi:hypothetical protein